MDPQDKLKDTEQSADAAIDTGVVLNDDTPVLSKAEERRRKAKIQMSRTLFRAIDVLYSGAQNSCPYINKKNMDTFSCTENIVYDEALPDCCVMDLYRPVSTDNDPLPALILIHGGGFSAGDKKYRKGQAQFFALNGFAVFCVNYGLAPDYVFPDPLKHLVNASNFIHDRAVEFGIDPDRIFMAGDSCGAYYSAMLCVLDTNEQFRNYLGVSLDFKIFGSLLNCGLYDLDTVMSTKYIFNLDDGVFLGFTGISRTDFMSFKDKDYYMPSGFINASFPPTFVIYSSNDYLCAGQGQILIEKLKEAGVYFEYYMARHTTSNHCFSLNWRGEDATAANELVLSFAKRLAAGKIKL